MKINWSKVIENATKPTENLNLFVSETADIWVIPDVKTVKMEKRCITEKVYDADFWNDIEAFLIDNAYANIYRCGTLEKLPVEPNKTVEAGRFVPKTGDVIVDTNECVIYVVKESLVRII